MTHKSKFLVLAGVLVGLVVLGYFVAIEVIRGEAAATSTPEGQASELSSSSAREAAESSTVIEQGVDADLTRQPAPSDATTGSLLVTVRWSTGEPAPGVSVSFRTWTRGLYSVILERAVSGSDGQILVSDLLPGTLNLRSDRGGRLEVEVTAGEQFECDFSLPAGIDITGIVTDREDEPIAGASVWLQTEMIDWSGGRIVTETGADGSFDLQRIPPGLSLGAIAPGFAPSRLVDLDTVDTSAPPVSVHLVLESGSGAVAGRVVDTAGDPIAGALIAIGARPRNMGLGMGGRWTESWTQRTTHGDEEGLFEFSGVKSGDQPVAARAAGFGLWRSEVQLADGDRAWLDVVMGRSITISGTVTDEEGVPLEKATVRAYDQIPGTNFVQGGQIDYDKTFGYVGAFTDAKGEYRLTGATPGSIHVYAQPERGSFMGETFPFARTVLEAQPGDELEWSPAIGPGRTIDGVVLYRDGRPMENVFITAKHEQGGPQHVLVNDQEGRFRFICLDAGTYSLHVQYWSPPKGTPPLEQGGIVPGRGTIELRAPFDKPVEAPAGVVTGRIDDVGGRIPHAKAVQLLLVYQINNAWRTSVDVQDDVFRFEDVEAGRYRVVVMAGEDAVAQTDWFEVVAAETKDVGVLTTDPPGTVVIEVDRGVGAADLEPTFSLTREGWSRGSNAAMGRSSELRMENVTPGTYAVTGYAPGMVRLRGTVEVRVGEESQVQFTLQPALLVRLEVWFPTGREAGNSMTRITDPDGAVLWESDRSHGEVPPRPHKVSAYVPRGQWTVTVTTDTGLAGTTKFDVDSVDGGGRLVRVDLN